MNLTLEKKASWAKVFIFLSMGILLPGTILSDIDLLNNTTYFTFGLGNKLTIYIYIFALLLSLYAIYSLKKEKYTAILFLLIALIVEIVMIRSRAFSAVTYFWLLSPAILSFYFVIMVKKNWINGLISSGSRDSNNPDASDQKIPLVEMNRLGKWCLSILGVIIVALLFPYTANKFTKPLVFRLKPFVLKGRTNIAPKKNPNISPGSLIKLNLISAKINDINFQEVNLTQLKASSSKIVDCAFLPENPKTGNGFTNLSKSSFEKATIQGTVFQDVILDHANFQAAIFKSRTPKDTTFFKYSGKKRYRVEAMNFKNARLQQVVFENIYFVKTSFEKAKIQNGIIFRNCDLSRVKGLDYKTIHQLKGSNNILPKEIIKEFVVNFKKKNKQAVPSYYRLKNLGDKTHYAKLLKKYKECDKF
ncbi:hypothetical protein BKI52_34350 [marine bacterium AO1-C]|nr:hypothetical protein BKI52_34350 [marine bacterium AO1-C]